MINIIDTVKIILAVVCIFICIPPVLINVQSWNGPAFLFYPLYYMIFIAIPEPMKKLIYMFAISQLFIREKMMKLISL